jgi:hypothetical protein
VVLTNSRKDILESSALDGSIDLSRAQRAIETEEVSNETRNMWCGHGSPGKALSRSVVKSGDDIETRSPDVDACTEVREGSLGVGNGGGGDGNGLVNTSWGGVDNVLVLVSSSNDNGDARVKELEEEQGISIDVRLI